MVTFWYVGCPGSHSDALEDVFQHRVSADICQKALERGSTVQVNLSQNSRLDIWCVRQRIELQIPVNSPVTNLQICTDSKAKTLGLKHLQFPDMGASVGRTDAALVVNHRTDELLVK